MTEPERPSFVYALGRVEPRFPSLGLEKEFAQVVARSDTAGRTDRQVFRSVILERENRYLARNLCWVFTVEGLETYLLVPRDPADLSLLVDSFREEPDGGDVDVVVGRRGPLAPPEMCNGLSVPVVAFDQIYSFDRVSLIASVPLPDSVGADREAQFRSTSLDLLDQFLQLADNAGATDDHRALNYLMLRYPDLYAMAADQYDRDYSFRGVRVDASPLSGVRSIVDVVFSFRHRRSDALERHYVRVDVTEEFPFLVSRISPFYER